MILLLTSILYVLGLILTAVGSRLTGRCATWCCALCGFPMWVVSGTVAALWLYNNFVCWLNFLNATLPPVGALIALDFFLHREDYAEGVPAKRDFNWGSIAGVIVGALVGNYLTIGIASVNAMIAACACYLLAEVVRKK